MPSLVCTMVILAHSLYRIFLSILPLLSTNTYPSNLSLNMYTSSSFMKFMVALKENIKKVRRCVAKIDLKYLPPLYRSPAFKVFTTVYLLTWSSVFLPSLDFPANTNKLCSSKSRKLRIIERVASGSVMFLVKNYFMPGWRQYWHHWHHKHLRHIVCGHSFDECR